MTLKREWEAIDASEGKRTRTTIQPGRHEVERVPNPLGHDNFWLVLKGTLIGGSEEAWRQWGDDTSDFQIVIEE